MTSGNVNHFMELFLIPVRAAEYELYFEPDGRDEVDVSGGAGMFAGMRRRFQEMLREAEHEHHHGPGHTPGDDGFGTRLRRHLMKWIVSRVMEQRLLWRLRSTDAVTAHIPEDLAEDEAQRIIRALLQSDADRHLRWMLVHLGGLVLSLPLVLVPGPNLIGYFFTFTVVGHFLAMRGARRGLAGVTWRVAPSAALSELRAALSMRGADRRRYVDAVAERLRLQRLAAFFDRIAVPTA